MAEMTVGQALGDVCRHFCGQWADQNRHDDACTALRTAPPYAREVLVDVLIYHTRTGIKGCRCGWAEPGRSWPEHVATVYEDAARWHQPESASGTSKTPTA